jgi:flavin reductase (DIM6/NTAB) family NADH-FMN oxidoreductase RutF
MRDNWYQRSSYLGSWFALITTVDEEGNTNVGPYQLTFPFEVNTGRSWIVISRSTSNTATNVKRTLKAALNFVEYKDEATIELILKLGFPGQTAKQKLEYQPFTLIDSPTPGRESSAEGGLVYPKIIAEAFQVFEVTLDVKRIEENPILRDSKSAHLLLNIDNILIKEEWMEMLDGSGDRMPHIPLTYGFRGGSTFWFGDSLPAYKKPMPDMGANHEIVHYEANRLDDDVRFTMEACKELKGIPNNFVRQVCQGIVNQAKKRGVTEVDKDFIIQLNNERAENP